MFGATFQFLRMVFQEDFCDDAARVVEIRNGIRSPSQIGRGDSVESLRVPLRILKDAFETKGGSANVDLSTPGRNRPHLFALNTPLYST